MFREYHNYNSGLCERDMDSRGDSSGSRGSSTLCFINNPFCFIFMGY